MAEEYIKKEDAIQSVVNHDLLKDEWSRDWAEYMLEDAKPADVVPVVRCKDCKWFNRFGCAVEIVDFTDRPTENDYCSFGERRDDE